MVLRLAYYYYCFYYQYIIAFIIINAIIITIIILLPLLLWFCNSFLCSTITPHDFFNLFNDLVLF